MNEREVCEKIIENGGCSFISGPCEGKCPFAGLKYSCLTNEGKIENAKAYLSKLDNEWIEENINEEVEKKLERSRVLNDEISDLLKKRDELRKAQPKAVSHEDICNLWWQMYDGVWMRVEGYHCGYYEINCVDVKKGWFIGRESAIVPPEGE